MELDWLSVSQANRLNKFKQDYPYVHMVHGDLGDVWNWILHSENDWRDKDFKWIHNVFFFKDSNDYLIFTLKWT